MHETYGVKGPVHKLEQRKAHLFSLLELPKLASLRSFDNFDVEFSPSGQILQITNYNLRGNPIGSKHFTYDANGKIVRSIERDEAGRETSVTDFDYQSDEVRILTSRNSMGELTGRILEAYRGRLLLSFSSYDDKGQRKREKSFQYVEDKLQSSDSRYYLPDGGLYEQCISRYDSDGRIISTYGLNAEGKPLGDGKYAYEYDEEGRESKVWSFNDWAEDDVANAVRVYEYETDPLGNWVERREFFRFRSDSRWTTQVTTRKLTYFPIK